MYLGIDLGTSALKAVLVSPDFEVVASASQSLSISHPRSGWSEQDPEDWWSACRVTIADLKDQNAAAFAALESIGLSGQMHGAVLLDAGGVVIRPAILWNDSRSAEQCQLIPERFVSLAGVGAMPGFTAPKLMWLSDEEPDSYDRVAKILFPKDYLGLRLHGQYRTDMSDAGGSYWLDQATMTWSDDLCQHTRTNPEWLPQLGFGSDIAGHLRTDTAAELGLPPGLPVACGAGDAAAAAVALGAVHPGTGFISLGTSGQLFVPTGSYLPPQQPSTHAFAHTLPETWYQMAAMLNGARALDWFSGVVGTDVPTLLTDAEQSPARRIPLFLPYLTGERTPHADPKIRGAFYGLENDTGHAQMARAVVEAIAYSFADAIDALSPNLPTPSTLLAVGGGARSDFLLQTISDVTGVTLARGSSANVGPAMGAAKLAAMAIGRIGVSDLAAPPIEREFTPCEVERDRHLIRLDAYRALYRQLQPVRDLLRLDPAR